MAVVQVILFTLLSAHPAHGAMRLCQSGYALSHSFVEFDTDCRSFLDLINADGRFAGPTLEEAQNNAVSYKEAGCPFPELETEGIANSPRFPTQQKLGEWTEAKKKRCAAIRLASNGAVAARTKASDSFMYQAAADACGLDVTAVRELGPAAATLYGSVGFNGHRAPKYDCSSAMYDGGSFMGPELSNNTELLDGLPSNPKLRKALKAEGIEGQSRYELYDKAGCPYSRPEGGAMSDFDPIDKVLMSAVYRQFRCQLQSLRNMKADQVLKAIKKDASISTEDAALLSECHWDAIRDYCGDVVSFAKEHMVSDSARKMLLKEVQDFYEVSNILQNIDKLKTPLFPSAQRDVAEAQAECKKNGDTECLMATAVYKARTFRLREDKSGIIEGFIEDATETRCDYIYGKSDYAYTVSDGCAREVVRLVAPAFISMPYTSYQKSTAVGMMSVLPAHMKRWTRDHLGKFLVSEGTDSTQPLVTERQTGNSSGEICWAFTNAVQFAWKAKCEALQDTEDKALEIMKAKLSSTCYAEIMKMQQQPESTMKLISRGARFVSKEHQTCRNFKGSENPVRCNKLPDSCAHGTLVEDPSDSDYCTCKCHGAWAGESCSILDRCQVIHPYINDMADGKVLKNVLRSTVDGKSYTQYMKETMMKQTAVVEKLAARIADRKAPLAMKNVLDAMGPSSLDDAFEKYAPTSVKMALKGASEEEILDQLDVETAFDESTRVATYVTPKLEPWEQEVRKYLLSGNNRQKAVDSLSSDLAQAAATPIGRPEAASSRRLSADEKKSSQSKMLEQIRQLQQDLWSKLQENPDGWDPDAKNLPSYHMRQLGSDAPFFWQLAYPDLILDGDQGYYLKASGVPNSALLEVGSAEQANVSSRLNDTQCKEKANQKASLLLNGRMASRRAEKAEDHGWVQNGNDFQSAPPMSQYARHLTHVQKSRIARTGSAQWTVRKQKVITEAGETYRAFYQCETMPCQGETRWMPSFSDEYFDGITVHPTFDMDDLPKYSHTREAKLYLEVSPELGEPPRIWDLRFMKTWSKQQWDRFWQQHQVQPSDLPGGGHYKPEPWGGSPTFGSGYFKYPQRNGKPTEKARRTLWRELIKAMQWAALRAGEPGDAVPDGEYPPGFKERWSKKLTDKEYQALMLIHRADLDLDRPRLDFEDPEEDMPKTSKWHAFGSLSSLSPVISWQYSYFQGAASSNTFSNRRHANSREWGDLKNSISASVSGASTFLSTTIPNTISNAVKAMSKAIFSNKVSVWFWTGFANVLSEIGKASWGVSKWVGAKIWALSQLIWWAVSEQIISYGLGEVVSHQIISEGIFKYFSGEIVSQTIISQGIGEMFSHQFLSNTVISGTAAWSKRWFIDYMSIKICYEKISLQLWESTAESRASLDKASKAVSAALKEFSVKMQKSGQKISGVVSSLWQTIKASLQKSWAKSTAASAAVWAWIAAVCAALSKSIGNVLAASGQSISAVSTGISTVSTAVSTAISTAVTAVSTFISETSQTYSIKPSKNAIEYSREKWFAPFSNLMSNVVKESSAMSGRGARAVYESAAQVWQKVSVDVIWGKISKESFYEGFSKGFIYEKLYQYVSVTLLYEGLSRGILYEGFSVPVATGFYDFFYTSISKNLIYDTLLVKVSYETISVGCLYKGLYEGISKPISEGISQASKASFNFVKASVSNVLRSR